MEELYLARQTIEIINYLFDGKLLNEIFIFLSFDFAFLLFLYKSVYKFNFDDFQQVPEFLKKLSKKYFGENNIGNSCNKRSSACNEMSSSTGPGYNAYNKCVET